MANIGSSYIPKPEKISQSKTQSAENDNIKTLEKAIAAISNELKAYKKDMDDSINNHENRLNYAENDIKNIKEVLT